MQVLGRVISSVSEFYKDLNPSTLSGAVDVVVVEDVQTGKLACSPFHVRFGKLQVLRPSEKKVDIEVNGRPVEGVSMKIGLAGETFFVLPVDGPVPSEYQTSPIPEPIKASTQGVPTISLTSPSKRVDPLSDSEVDKQQPQKRKGERRRPSKIALSDSEAEAAAAGDEEWTWKWGDLPEREHHEADLLVDAEPPKVAEDTIALEEAVHDLALEVTQTPVEQKEAEMIESMLLNEATPIPEEAKPVALKSYLSSGDVISKMYNRLLEIVEEGVEEVELCLFYLEKTTMIKISELDTLKSVTAELRSVPWDEYEKDPEKCLTSSVICVFGPSTKWLQSVPRIDLIL